MKYIILFIIIFTAVVNVYTDEIKTKADFIFPEPMEQPLINLIPDNFNPMIGFSVSSAAAISGITLLVVNGYNTSNNFLADPDIAVLSQGLILSGTYLIGSAISMIFIDFFLDKISNNKITLKE